MRTRMRLAASIAVPGAAIAVLALPALSPALRPPVPPTVCGQRGRQDHRVGRQIDRRLPGLASRDQPGDDEHPAAARRPAIAGVTQDLSRGEPEGRHGSGGDRAAADQAVGPMQAADHHSAGHRPGSGRSGRRRTGPAAGSAAGRHAARRDAKHLAGKQRAAAGAVPGGAAVEQRRPVTGPLQPGDQASLDLSAERSASRTAVSPRLLSEPHLIGILLRRR